MGVKELINHQDFLSTEISIKLKNMGTETVVDSKKRTVGSVPVEEASKSDLIQILEILPNGMTMSIPRYTCAVGHTLELDLNVAQLSKDPIDLRLTVRVMEIEKASEEQERIIVDLKMISDAGWKKFCQAFAARQEAIQDFFKNVRGY